MKNTRDDVLLLGEVPTGSVEHLLTWFNTPADAVGISFLHTWFVAEDNKDTVFRGTLLRLKKKKKCTFVVSYHTLGESEDEDEDYDVTRSQLVTDLLLGELEFV